MINDQWGFSIWHRAFGIGRFRTVNAAHAVHSILAVDSIFIKETHRQQLLPVTPRRVRDFPASKKIPFIYRRFAIDELRYKDDQNWLWLRPGRGQQAGPLNRESV